MSRRMNRIVSVVVVLMAVLAAQAAADPLPGEVLKFEQFPLVAGPNGGYPGHDEISTIAPANVAPGYTGQYMADDFADKFSTPVVDVGWWGSYLQGSGATQFLISFESDVPADPAGEFSHPGQVLSAQIVTLGALTAGSGTFTETAVPNPGSPDGNLFQYNAELSVPFAEQPNTVYWLKIVAIQQPGQGFVWGWHDRDWSIQNPLASTAPAVSPGEHVLGMVAPGIPVYHFQDDAVSGTMTLDPTTLPLPGPISPGSVHQALGTPQNYILPWDGPAAVPGTTFPGIDSFSKDLAFSLYTRTPEPSTFVLLGLGSLACGLSQWRKARRGL